MRIYADTAAERHLLARRLPALRHLLGLEPVTNLPPDPMAELLELLAPALAQVDRAELERCLQLEPAQ